MRISDVPGPRQATTHAGGASPGAEVPPVSCDRCHSRLATPLFSSEDYLSGERFEVVRCGDCGLLRTDFRERAHDLSFYYGPAYYGTAGRRFMGGIERAVGLFRNARARMVARLAGQPGRILDLGCGRGLMLAALQNMGWQCVGTEVSADLAEAARGARGLEVHSEGIEPLPFPDASFDAVTTWHSLEHMERPVGTLGDIFRILRPGGLLVIEIPNAAGLQARWGGPGWFHLDVPRHLYHFSRSELTEILVGLGFSIVQESTFSPEYGPYGMVQSLLNRVTFHPNALYRLIKRVPSPQGSTREDRRRMREIWDIAATVVLAVPLGVVGTVLEVLACLAGRGGVVRVAAIKRR